MLGLLLITAGTTLEEAAVSVGKVEMKKRRETPFGFGVLVATVGLLLFIFSALARWPAQHFDPASIPLLVLRAILEIFQSTVTIFAIKYASRSTFGFLRTLTIPGLLVSDLFFSYQVDLFQIGGISLIVCALLLLYINHGLSKKGAWLALASAINAVFTISIYKYNITHFNSPEVDQIIILTVLSIYFILMSVFHDRINPLKLFKHRAGLWQASLSAVGGTLDALSFLFGAPSVLIAVKRTMSVLASIVSGRAVFAEKHMAVKLTAFAFCAVGIILLVL